MNATRRRLAAITGRVALLVLIGGGCGPAAGPGPATPPREATEVAGVTGPAGTPEKTTLKLGVSSHSAIILPTYLAAERTFREEGLAVEVIGFGGGGPVAQALASDSLDVSLMGLSGVLDLLRAGHEVRVFYVGASRADFEWHARPEVRRWSDLRGRSVGVASYGSLTDSLTRYVLRKHGLDPERDVSVAQVGGSPTAIQALEAGRVDAVLLSSPFTWQAASKGFSRLGSMSTEVADEWPQAMFAAKARFLQEHPNTVRALLRAHVRALRLARADREAGVQALIGVLKFERPDAGRAYDEVVPGFDERGPLPAKGMPVFWEIAVAAGEVTEPWPESRFFDPHFVDTFDAWAPR